VPPRRAEVGIAARLLVLVVRAYQFGLSPLLGGHCRFSPSCSEYAIEALRRHGAIHGAWLALTRVARCQPWGGLGHDPVPSSSANRSLER
jgi:putative membrane protein insertion efficiency factor